MYNSYRAAERGALEVGLSRSLRVVFVSCVEFWGALCWDELLKHGLHLSALHSFVVLGWYSLTWINEDQIKFDQKMINF